MKLVLDTAKCDRHGQCVGAAPSLLAWNSDGSLRIVKEKLEPGDREEAEDACALCPTQSLSIVED